ncbi:MAG: MerR family DNA-binding transcriptional regulator [Chlorobi bacterium]|nr:MerR family DNA-binding transcriptional regulator [Chlorobiota bacterium]
MKKFYSISEAAELMGVSKETLRRWDKSGKFPSHRHPVNNYRMYSHEQIQHYLREMGTPYEIPFEDAPRIRTPFFETELGKLYHADALDILKNLPSESVDLIFADPPYNIGKARWDIFPDQEAYLAWTMEWIREAHRVLKPHGSLYVCGFSEILADIKYKAAPLFYGVKWLVWYYRNKANLSNDWGRAHESILHFRKSKNFIFNIDPVRIPYNAHTLKYPERTQAETSQYAGKKSKNYRWTPHPLGAKPKDVFEIPTISNHAWEKYPHPTQKPVELLRKIILASSHPGQLVLDPFGGSGTTYAVAEALGRRWTGAEIDENYCEIIRTRLQDQAHLQRIAGGNDAEQSARRRKKLRQG